MREREGLIARVRQLRRAGAAAEDRSGPTGQPASDPMHALEERVAHLEQLVEGLQDSVHREALRHDKRIGDLEARTQPGVLSQALSKDARERGL